MSSLGIVFAGTPAFAAKHLKALIDSGHNILAVYTQPDRAAGRGKHLQASPVKLLAMQANIPVYQPVSLKAAEAQKELAQLNPDLMIVVAYGLLLPQAILDIPRRGCINVHASILPRWRGAAPIERALLAGDAETGVTIMQMDAGLDTGNMLHILKTDVRAFDTREMLETRLAEIGCAGLLHALDNLDQLQLSAQVQDDSLSTYAKKLDKTEALIDWNYASSQIDLVVRAGVGRNPAYTFLNGLRVRIMQARPVDDAISAAPGRIVKVVRGQNTCIAVACGEGALELEIIQLPGKNPVHVKHLLNGHSHLLTDGAIFSQQENS